MKTNNERRKETLQRKENERENIKRFFLFVSQANLKSVPTKETPHCQKDMGLLTLRSQEPSSGHTAQKWDWLYLLKKKKEEGRGNKQKDMLTSWRGRIGVGDRDRDRDEGAYSTSCSMRSAARCPRA